MAAAIFYLKLFQIANELRVKWNKLWLMNASQVLGIGDWEILLGTWKSAAVTSDTDKPTLMTVDKFQNIRRIREAALFLLHPSLGDRASNYVCNMFYSSPAKPNLSRFPFARRVKLNMEALNYWKHYWKHAAQVIFHTLSLVDRNFETFKKPVGRNRLRH